MYQLYQMCTPYHEGRGRAQAVNPKQLVHQRPVCSVFEMYQMYQMCTPYHEGRGGHKP